MHDLLSAAWQPLLTTRAVGRGDNCVEHTLTSTNTVLKELARNGARHGSVCLCECQTGGRGRLGRAWSSPEGRGIWCSVLLRPEMPAERAPLITFCAALAVTRAVRRLCGLEVRIKWPNDVVLDGRKLCGVLLEMGFDVHGGMFVIVGTGLNVRRGAYPPELSDRAIALEEVCAPPERGELIAAYLSELELALTEVEKSGLPGIAEAYRELSCTLGSEVQVIGTEERFTGVAEEIDQSGALLVRDADGELRRVLAGDVSVRGMMGYV
ncbi:MAG: biotin--[acetyl-CoA-carboxylase] ligase [Clostridiales bacterium]|nr:biotin--[acetyl-CoA-carboxylase] ligase [Clostridiales bacterium]